MNATIDQKAPLSPNDPAYYAPRVPRDGDQTRLPRLGETRSYRPPATSITDTTVEAKLEDAVRDSLRHPLDPEAVEEPAEFERAGLLGVIGRFAAAVGAAAFVALLFVIVIPSLRQQPGSEPTTAEVIDSMKAAIAKSEPVVAKPREPQPAIELQATAPSSEGGDQPSHEDSEALLKKFMQWQNKPAEAQDKN